MGTSQLCVPNHYSSIFASVLGPQIRRDGLLCYSSTELSFDVKTVYVFFSDIKGHSVHLRCYNLPKFDIILISWVLLGNLYFLLRDVFSPGFQGSPIPCRSPVRLLFVRTFGWNLSSNLCSGE